MGQDGEGAGLPLVYVWVSMGPTGIEPVTSCQRRRGSVGRVRSGLRFRAPQVAERISRFVLRSRVGLEPANNVVRHLLRLPRRLVVREVLKLDELPIGDSRRQIVRPDGAHG